MLLAPVEGMENPAPLETQAPPVPPDLLAPPDLVETLRRRWRAASMRRRVERRWVSCRDPWALWDPAAPLAPLAHLVPRDFKATPVSPANPALLVRWVPGDLRDHLGNPVTMVRQANPANLVNVAPPAPRALVASLGLLVSPE